MKRIEKLTPEQIARFPEFVEKWTRIGLCTDPADRPRAEAGIRLAYQAAQIEPPKAIVWCGSPLSQGLTRAIVLGLKDAEVKIGASVRDSVGASVWASVWDSVWASVRASVGASVWDSVWASVRASVGASVWDSVGDSVWASVRASVWDSVGDSVWASVRASVGASVRASVGASVRDSVGASVGASVRDSGYGQHDANWLGFYDYFRLACGMDETTQRLAGMWDIAHSAGWWLPHKNLCWVSERHNILNRNADGRLHCGDGPALSYPDGWSIWSIDGVRVNEQIVMRPESQTIQQIEAEANEEIRRIRIDRFGWPKYLAQSGATPIDSRTNDVDGTRESLLRLTNGSLRLLCACRSTARVYAVGVPREIQTCEQAQSWMATGSSFAGKKLNVIGAS